MGVKIFDIEDILKFSKEYLDNKLSNLNLLELGEQELKIFNNELDNNITKNFLEKNPRKYSNKMKNRIGIYCKDFLNSIFNKVSSIDTHTTCKKTLKLNLIDEIDLGEKFDVITNFGTTEHVGEYDNILKNTQYQAFKNIHNLLNSKGLVFNVVPAKYENNVIHGAFNYSTQFFEKLAELCNYKILYNEIKKRGDIYHVYCYFLKLDESTFISEKEFNQLINLLLLTERIKPNPKKYLESIQY